MPKTLTEISEAMQGIDFAMLVTKTEGGALGGRPMSNNGEVAYDGDSWFFALDDATMIGDINRDPQVGLTYAGQKSLLGKPGIFIHVEGAAELLRDKAAFATHWTRDLDRWFEQGIETPGLVLIRVRATRIHYWDGEDEGEVRV